MGKSYIYIYIYIANGAPTILNVDNETDGEAWERLGAIRMPESMATEIFGENVKYADNTTCVITENSGNAEFPFNVQFDASKIMAKPKTTRKLTGNYLAMIGMPSGKIINIGAQPNGYTYTMPYSGYFYVRGISGSGGGNIILQGGALEINNYVPFSNNGISVCLPAIKGYRVVLYYSNITLTDVFLNIAKGEV